MKITNIEKALIAFTVVFALAVSVASHFVIKGINESGGVRGIIVKAGKEIKEINNEINED